MSKNKVYSAEFKIKVVEDILANKITIRESERKYKVEHSVIRQWIRHYKEDGPSYFEVDHRGRHKQNPSYNSMSDKEKVHYLEMELDIIKKAKALALIK